MAVGMRSHAIELPRRLQAAPGRPDRALNLAPHHHPHLRLQSFGIVPIQQDPARYSISHRAAQRQMRFDRMNALDHSATSRRSGSLNGTSMHHAGRLQEGAGLPPRHSLSPTNTDRFWWTLHIYGGYSFRCGDIPCSSCSSRERAVAATSEISTKVVLTVAASAPKFA